MLHSVDDRDNCGRKGDCRRAEEGASICSTHVVRFSKPVGDRFGRGMKAIPAIAIPCDRDGELMADAPCFPPRDREPAALSHAGAREQLHRPVAGPATRRSP